MIWGYVGCALVALLMGFGGGWKTHSWKTASDEKDRLALVDKQKEENAAKVDTASAKFEGKSAEADVRERVVVKEVIRVVQKPVYRERCLDDDGMRILTSDITAANARRELTPALPASAPASGPE